VAHPYWLAAYLHALGQVVEASKDVEEDDGNVFATGLHLADLPQQLSEPPPCIDARLFLQWRKMYFAQHRFSSSSDPVLPTRWPLMILCTSSSERGVEYRKEHSDCQFFTLITESMVLLL
jgi:hypothetical protein